MRVFIRECGAVNVKEILPFIKNEVEVYIFGDEDILIGDYVICSKEDRVFLSDNRWKYKCLIYEDINKKILSNLGTEYYYNYDYYHLKNEIEKGKSKDIETLISGSSYGLFGIDLDYIDKTSNLSMISQDLYYSLRGIYEVCRINGNIKNIVLFTPYYYFFNDLSRTQNEQEIARVSKVYDRLFSDMHSCVLLSPKYDVLYKSEIFNIPMLFDIVLEQECKKGYFCESHSRKNCATRIWDNKEKDWVDLSVTEKKNAGKTRALSHMKVCKYNNTLQENRLYFTDFVDFTIERGIRLLLVIPPCTKYYSNYISSDCKSSFFETIVGLNLNYIDLTDDRSLDEDDFNDMDHLNDKGAVKMTRLLSDIIMSS